MIQLFARETSVTYSPQVLTRTRLKASHHAPNPVKRRIFYRVTLGRLVLLHFGENCRSAGDPSPKSPRDREALR